MPKTIMAPLVKVLSLGIILLLVSHLGESSPSPDAQMTAEKDDNTVKEGMRSKRSFFNSKGVKR